MLRSSIFAGVFLVLGSLAAPLSALQSGDCATVSAAACAVNQVARPPQVSTDCFGCPSGSTQAYWNSESMVGQVPRLRVPRFQPNPAYCETLIQVDLEFVAHQEGFVGLENRNLVAPCTGEIVTIDSALSVTALGALTMAPVLLDLTQSVSVPPLATFDDVVDFAGPSGVSLAIGHLQTTECRRFVGADVGPFLDPSPAAADDLLEFAHSCFDSSSHSGCGMITFMSDPSAALELRATYTICRTPWPCLPSSVPFCSGDGASLEHTTTCPCGNSGASGRGCANSVHPAGALLIASGTAAADDVQLQAWDMPGTSLALFLQHDSTGDGLFHDGVLCASGNLTRLRARGAVGGAASFPDLAFPSDATLTLSQRGGVTPGSGARRYYSTFYRNASSTFCPPATANVTNGWLVDW